MEQEKKILQEGQTYTLTEIADWFNMKITSFRNVKEEKLQELALYYDFEPVGTKILIKKLLNPENAVYQKRGVHAKQHIDQQYSNYWPVYKYDTVSNIGSVLYFTKPNTAATIKESSFQTWLNRKKMIDYGFSRTKIVQVQIPGSKKTYKAVNKVVKEGALGYCESRWCKLYGAIGQNLTLQDHLNRRYEPLTDEELNFFYQKYAEWCGDLHIIIAELNEEVQKEDCPMSKEEAWDITVEQAGITGDSYTEFISKMAKEFNCDWIVKATRLIPKDVDFTTASVEEESFDF